MEPIVSRVLGCNCRPTVPRYANIVNYIVAGCIPLGADKKIIRDIRVHLWGDPYLCRVCADGLHRRCIPSFETWKILECCHAAPYGSHYGPFHTNAKVWQSGFYWPTIYEDIKSFVRRCSRCQKHGNINARDVIPLMTNLQIDIFDVWGIDFMGPFPNSEGCEYILLAVNYVSKWVDALCCRALSQIRSPLDSH
jgi:hypothetical protein